MSLAVAVALGVAALVIGFSKTALGGLAAVSVAIFATVLPARQSTGAILAVLIVGDLVAIWQYRHDCDWALVRQLVPTVLPGLALGAVFLHVVDDAWLRRSIGLLLLVMVALQLALLARPSASRWAAARGGGLTTGLGAGFATMTANAAGAVMTLYLVAKGIEKRRFVGTGAWFFFGVNLCKVPFSVGLGLLHPGDVVRAVALAPLVVAGGWLGLHSLRLMSQAVFERAVLVASAVSALALIVC